MLDNIGFVRRTSRAWSANLLKQIDVLQNHAGKSESVTIDKNQYQVIKEHVKRGKGIEEISFDLKAA